MVLEHLTDRLFTPDRLQVVLEAYIAHSADADAARREQLAQARRALTEAQGRIARLLGLVEQGLLMGTTDPNLKERSTPSSWLARARKSGCDCFRPLAPPVEQ
jgi:hypothetical protein